MPARKEIDPSIPGSDHQVELVTSIAFKFNNLLQYDLERQFPGQGGDLVQEYYLQILEGKRGSGIDPTDPSFPFVRRQAKQLAVDVYRRDASHLQIDPIILDDRGEYGIQYGVASPLDHPESAILNQELQAVLADALSQIPFPQQQAIILQMNDYSQKQIADETGDPLGTVKTRLRLGKMKLSPLIGPYISDSQE